MPVKPVNWAMVVAVVAVPLGEAFAGGKAVECYRERYRPAVYDTVHERVQIQ